ncbi:uncharacterized protein (TIGR02145 family) [Fibrobacter sp. UWR4]|nr:uncharacterized protein (TIGR02145 family) [Fibrobacter sp. UWR4]PZW71879.1 uncharacterized protein (TIGR02145 family) [Fibrobacter sp. UWR1]
MKNSKYFLSALWLCVFALFLASCSDDSKTAGGSTEDSGIVAIKDRDVAGVAQKGPFVKGSAVTVYELEGKSLNPTGRIFTTKVSSDKGEYAFQKLNLVSQYAVFEALGYYRNEVTGEISSGTVTLSALVDLTETDSVNINVLTHIDNDRVRELVQDGSGFADARKKSKTEISSAFGMTPPTAGFENLDVFGNDAGDAELLAVSMMLQSDLKSGELGSRLADVSEDIAQDGEWNDESVKGEIANWVASANLDSIYANVNSWGFAEQPVEKSDLYSGFVEENKQYISERPSEILDSSASDGEESSSSEKVESSGSSSSADSPASSSSVVVTGETFVDERDGNVYRYVKIGYQVWMAENLRYVSTGSHCFNDDESECEKFGRLYEYSEGLCPAGWHMPTQAEWTVLFDAVGGVDVAGKALRAVGAWNVENYPLTADDTDAYGFSALPSGVYIFGDHENAGFYLSSTLVGGDAVYDVGIVGNGDSAYESNALFTTAISARCVMD